ncbi:hypothetical protein [Streptomyces sp. NPDC059466]|uniref:hypothetical protein n=1 Tax=unclassified Streptomyces TaxID=2593676 RepID=UPI0036B34E05
MSYACRNSGAVTAALDPATRALAVAQRPGGRPALAEALLCHGEAPRDLYRFDEAARALTRAVGGGEHGGPAPRASPVRPG